jgi:hypothetical protein
MTSRIELISGVRPEFDHFKILERKRLGQAVLTETETRALRTALKPTGQLHF